MNMTIQYLQASMHRALNSGEKELTVSVYDIKELLASLESLETRERIETVGRSLGFVRAEQARTLLGSRTSHIPLHRKKNRDKDVVVEVFYRELPPKPPKDPEEKPQECLAPEIS
ncbi:hypothetical protein AH02_29 [Pseudomonas phage AH02]|nr:hypothetical protein AH02_29 [Pseudomonas phage AH02]